MILQTIQNIIAFGERERIVQIFILLPFFDMTPVSKKRPVKKVAVKETISPKKKMQRTSRLARANLLAFIAVLIVNYLANALPL